MTLSVTPVSPADLGRREISTWARLQEADRFLGSPFFRPEFSLAVGAVRSDARVAVLEREHGVVGFLPYQRARRRVGEPIGGERSNYQGVIAERDLEWDARHLIRGCGLQIWKFHHLITSQAQFERFYLFVDSSPQIELAGGFETYARRLEARGSHVLRRLRQQIRRIEREVGPLTFEPHDPAPETLHQMMRWKSDQYRRTNSVDRFASRWNVELLERIHATQADGFRGMLPTLYAGDQLIAVAMCMRSRNVLHWWFPTYNQALATYSPGMLLLLMLAQQGAAMGIETIDLGRGPASYKDRLATTHAQVAEGAVTVPSLRSSIRALGLSATRAVRGSPLRRPARTAAQAGRRLRSPFARSVQDR